jgi:hypothetical protein
MRLLLRAGLLCNDARLEQSSDTGCRRIAGDPAEGAFARSQPRQATGTMI